MSDFNVATEETWRIFRIMAEFVEGFEELANIGPAVSIFGSARTEPDEPYYSLAVETARLESLEEHCQVEQALAEGHGPDHLGQVRDNPSADRLQVRPHAEVVRAEADHEVAGILKEVEISPDMTEAVVADLSGDSAIGYL